MTGERLTRRPIRARGSRWAQALAGALTRAGASPNAISLLSVACAAGAAAGFLVAREAAPGPRAALLVLAALGIQLRLLCNLLDGMVAVEGGRRTATGELYNELPDRVSDVLILVAAGYAVPAAPGAALLGWTAAVLAVLTAYVRALGASLTGSQHFVGPMAKAHRMATLTVACLLGAGQSLAGGSAWAVPAALAVVVAGSLVTVARRTRLIRAELERHPPGRAST